MKISILLPYKENYSDNYAGAVSLFINDTTKLSKFKKNIRIFGSTNFKSVLSKNYTNIELNKKILFQSQSRFYVNKFVELQKNINADIIEIHNRPNYLRYIKKLNSKIVLYFHNDPLEMAGSEKVKDRLDLMVICEKIIFNSEWSKNRFIAGLDSFYSGSTKLEVINQSTNKPKIDLKKKKKYNNFCWKIKFSKRLRFIWRCNIKNFKKA